MTAPIDVDTTRLRLIGSQLGDESRALLLPVWDALSRGGVPADPRAAEAPPADVAAGLTTGVAALAEAVRRSLVELQDIGDSLVRSAQAYEESERESHRLTREIVDAEREEVPVPHTDPSRWKL